MGILEALEYKLSRQERPKRTFYIAFGHDEEVGGNQGAKELSAKLGQVLEQHEERLDFILDEGMFVIDGVLPGVARPVAYFGVVEKGWATLSMKAKGGQGHSSTPPRDTAVSKLARAINNLKENLQPSRFGSGTEISTLEYLAPYAGFEYAMAMANLWLLEPLVRAEFSDDYRWGKFPWISCSIDLSVKDFRFLCSQEGRSPPYDDGSHDCERRL